MNQKIRVEIDEDLRGLIPGYLESMQNHIASFRADLLNGEVEAVRQRGHNIKGSGGGYGFDEISEFGRSIESAAKENRLDDASTFIEALADFMENVDIVYVVEES